MFSKRGFVSVRLPLEFAGGFVEDVPAQIKSAFVII